MHPVCSLIDFLKNSKPWKMLIRVIVNNPQSHITFGQHQVTRLQPAEQIPIFSPLVLLAPWPVAWTQTLQAGINPCYMGVWNDVHPHTDISLLSILIKLLQFLGSILHKKCEEAVIAGKCLSPPSSCLGSISHHW